MPTPSLSQGMNSSFDSATSASSLGAATANKPNYDWQNLGSRSLTSGRTRGSSSYGQQAPAPITPQTPAGASTPRTLGAATADRAWDLGGLAARGGAAAWSMARPASTWANNAVKATRFGRGSGAVMGAGELIWAGKDLGGMAMGLESPGQYWDRANQGGLVNGHAPTNASEYATAAMDGYSNGLMANYAGHLGGLYENVTRGVDNTQHYMNYGPQSDAISPEMLARIKAQRGL